MAVYDFIPARDAQFLAWSENFRDKVVADAGSSVRETKAVRSVPVHVTRVKNGRDSALFFELGALFASDWFETQ